MTNTPDAGGGERIGVGIAGLGRDGVAAAAGAQASARPAERPGRRSSPARDFPLIVWLLTAVAVSLVHRWVPGSTWLMIHLVLLGALSHSILVWSFHFAQTVLRAPAGPVDVRMQTRRLWLLTAGAACVFVGVPSALYPLTVLGGLMVAAAVAWHAATLWRMLRRALPGRFRVTVRYYLAAAGCLLLGATLGMILAWGWTDPWHGRLLVAHAMANVLGWVGLTMVGTLLLFWPTLLGAKLDPMAERWTRQALPVFGSSIAVAVLGALVGVSYIAALGVVGYLCALGLFGRGLCRPARTNPPRQFPAASVAAGMVWLVVGLGWTGWLLATTSDWADVRASFGWAAAMLAAGCALQVLMGALSHLLPSVLAAGNPAVRDAAMLKMHKAGGFRIVTLNGGLLLWLLAPSSWLRVTGSMLALASAVAFLPLMILGLRAGLAQRRLLAASAAAGEPPAPAPAVAKPRPGVFSAGQLIAGVTAILCAVVVGVGQDPAAAGFTSGPSATVTPTGQVVRIDVKIEGMHYLPNRVEVNAGDQLVVTLTNSGTTTHDLVIGSERSERIAPGSSTVLDAGVIAQSIQGYCSVVGHRQMGMVFDVVVAGDSASAEPASATAGMHDSGMHDSVTAPDPSPSVPKVIDPVLPALPKESVHRITLRVQEVPLEVAPGVWQRRWTFNGRAPGPVLHGRVGDVFEVTLVNDGSIGHSIDFHAGSLAPDRPMRTIEPGQQLTYRFTATMAGIWMYHCSTMPMSAHIAAGMTGAVIIEPDGLPAVDRSYALVQSEVYLQSAAPDADSATEVDADAAGSGQADYVVLNGIANGYDGHPLSARVGERVRFWVLDAGPNRPSSFHIVGAQFDTVFHEGAYLLRRGQDAFGERAGGSQALGLHPAQGGFVEAVFPEAGRYPLVSHVMADAERGAHGYVQVGD